MIARFIPLAVLAGSTLLVTGCGSFSSALGSNKNPPDEFAIVTKAPLTVPPDFALEPPQPGETRPERLSTADRTRQLLIGDASTAPPTDGELALLQNVGSLDVDGNIRTILAAENGGRADKDASLANQLVFWTFEDGEINDADAPLRVENAEAWKADRHKSIETVTGDGQVVISRDQRVLNLPGVK